ncbi:MAG: D-alanyl-D-alanine carboxypeptidase [Candidatus Pacebacteria bacterium]|nr:D-alanyl-D-alanine carboxypeptidase [Candidatus Paceibacterota bacterium]
MVIIVSVILYFAFVGAVRVSAGLYVIASEKYQEIYANRKISFGRGIVVQDGLGGPYPESFESDKATFLRNYRINDGAKLPNIGARYFLVGDIETNQIIFSKEEGKSVPLASLTKLMTAVIADEKIGLEKETIISRSAINTYGEQGNVRQGEKYSIENLFYPLLLESSNDVAESIAEFDNRYTFLLDMNAKAKLLNMTETFYEDPSGLSSHNVSSANDLFKLVQYISKYRNFIFEITQEKSHRLNNKVWFSNSKFKNYKNYLGGKNGYISAAGKTNIALFEIEFEGDHGEKKDNKRKIAIIILNTRDIEKDTRNILNYLQNNVRYE